MHGEPGADSYVANTPAACRPRNHLPEDMSYPGFGDIVLFVNLANRIYEYGFTKANRARKLKISCLA